MSGAEINAKLAALRERAAQQPVSYKMLFDEAMETADDLFHRIGALEAALREIEKHHAYVPPRLVKIARAALDKDAEK